MSEETKAIGHLLNTAFVYRGSLLSGIYIADMLFPYVKKWIEDGSFEDQGSEAACCHFFVQLFASFGREAIFYAAVQSIAIEKHQISETQLVGFLNHAKDLILTQVQKNKEAHNESEV